MTASQMQNPSIWSRSPYLRFQEAPRLRDGQQAPLLPFLIRREALRVLRRQPGQGGGVKLVGLRVTLSETAFAYLKEKYARLYSDAPSSAQVEGLDASRLWNDPAERGMANISTTDEYNPQADYEEELKHRLERWLSEQLAAARTTDHLRGWKTNFVCSVKVIRTIHSASQASGWARFFALLLGAPRKGEPGGAPFQVELNPALDAAACMQHRMRPVTPCYLPSYQFTATEAVVGRDHFKTPGCDLNRITPLVAARHAEFSLIEAQDRNHAQLWLYHLGEHETWVHSGGRWFQCAAHMWRRVEPNNKILFGRLAAHPGAPACLEPAPGSLLLAFEDTSTGG